MKKLNPVGTYDRVYVIMVFQCGLQWFQYHCDGTFATTKPIYSIRLYVTSVAEIPLPVSTGIEWLAFPIG